MKHTPPLRFDYPGHARRCEAKLDAIAPQRGPFDPFNTAKAEKHGVNLRELDMETLSEKGRLRKIALATIRKVLGEKAADRAEFQSDDYISAMWDSIPEEPENTKDSKGQRSQTRKVGECEEGYEWDHDLGQCVKVKRSKLDGVADEARERFEERQATQHCTTDHERATVVASIRERRKFDAEQFERGDARLDAHEPDDSDELAAARQRMVDRQRNQWRDPPRGGNAA